MFQHTSMQLNESISKERRQAKRWAQEFIATPLEPPPRTRPTSRRDTQYRTSKELKREVAASNVILGYDWGYKPMTSQPIFSEDSMTLHETLRKMPPESRCSDRYDRIVKSRASSRQSSTDDVDGGWATMTSTQFRDGSPVTRRENNSRPITSGKDLQHAEWNVSDSRGPSSNLSSSFVSGASTPTYKENTPPPYAALSVAPAPYVPESDVPRPKLNMDHRPIGTPFPPPMVQHNTNPSDSSEPRLIRKRSSLMNTWGMIGHTGLKGGEFYSQPSADGQARANTIRKFKHLPDSMGLY